MTEGVSAGQTAPRQGDAGPNEALLALILRSLDDDKAEDVVTIPLAGKSEIADHMVVASGRSTRQVAAIADKLLERLKREGGVLARAEGMDAADWVLIDAGDALIHIFRPEVREFYQLEKMWQPAQGPQGAEPAAPARASA
ncbi:MAG: ribosome silencing factor [Pseudomonadota bacterium]